MGESGAFFRFSYLFRFARLRIKRLLQGLVGCLQIGNTGVLFLDEHLVCILCLGKRHLRSSLVAR